MLTLDAITDALRRHQPQRQPAPETIRQRAAVALVLAGPPERLELCLIKRAEREGDRWSGQIALPGGRASTGDADMLATAMRETREEVGVVLRREQLLGELDELALHRHGGAPSGVLTSAVFRVGQERPTLAPDPSEVARTFWLPLHDLLNPALRTEHVWEREGHAMRFPGVLVDGEVLWGLTWRVLSDLVGLLGGSLIE